MFTYLAKAIFIGIILILIIQVSGIIILSESIKECKPKNELKMETSFTIVRRNSTENKEVNENLVW